MPAPSAPPTAPSVPFGLGASAAGAARVARAATAAASGLAGPLAAAPCGRLTRARAAALATHDSGGTLRLFIANKNYSSWSLRPWILMRERGIPFEEVALTFGDAPSWAPLRAHSAAGKVPVLLDGGAVVWDSLAIVEYLAERFPGVWPVDSTARAWARSGSAEMHSGFYALRAECSMCIGIRVRLYRQSPALAADIARVDALWGEGLARFGGPFLAGSAFSAVDAFFAPVAYRVRTYGLALSGPSAAYGERLLGLPAMRAWEAAALAETSRDEPHEQEIRASGEWSADFRAR